MSHFFDNGSYTASYRANARKHMERFLSFQTHSKHPDLFPSRMKRDQSNVSAVKDIITSMFVNPFEEMELTSLSSGVPPPENVALDLFQAYNKGHAEVENL